MLKPASVYKDEIQTEFKRLQYSEDMFYASGDMSSWVPEIDDAPNGYNFQYAVVDNNGELKGYIGFILDWYARNAHSFGIVSFDKNSLYTAESLNKILDMLISEWNVHRIEWRMISGNPAQKAYDRFMKKYNGKCYILKDTVRDYKGNYHDDHIYEIVFDNK